MDLYLLPLLLFNKSVRVQRTEAYHYLICSSNHFPLMCDTTCKRYNIELRCIQLKHFPAHFHVTKEISEMHL